MGGRRARGRKFGNSRSRLVSLRLRLSFSKKKQQSVIEGKVSSLIPLFLAIVTPKTPTPSQTSERKLGRKKGAEGWGTNLPSPPRFL